MTLLVEATDLNGCLKTIHDDPDARDFDGPQVGHVRLLSIPQEQDLEFEVEFLTAQLPSHVVSMGGEYDDGTPWILLVEFGPTASDEAAGDAAAPRAETLARLFERATISNPEIIEVRNWEIDPTELRAYYEWSVDEEGVAIDLTFCEQLRGLVAEACGYPIAELVARYDERCAFPDDDHECQGELLADVFQGWIDGLI